MTHLNGKRLNAGAGNQAKARTNDESEKTKTKTKNQRLMYNVLDLKCFQRRKIKVH